MSNKKTHRSMLQIVLYYDIFQMWEVFYNYLNILKLQKQFYIFFYPWFWSFKGELVW